MSSRQTSGKSNDCWELVIEKEKYGFAAKKGQASFEM
jgi:hypothetical protein